MSTFVGIKVEVFAWSVIERFNTESVGLSILSPVLFFEYI